MFNKKLINHQISIKDVVKVSKLYLPNMAKGFDSEKLKLHIGDGFEFLKNNKNQFDVIITDSSDPEGNRNFQCQYEANLRLKINSF